MAFDQTKIGQLTAALMENLDAQYGEDCEFGDVLILTEILGPHGSHVATHSNQNRKHVQLGLLAVAERAVLDSHE
jgi:hypothetical protein